MSEFAVTFDKAKEFSEGFEQGYNEALKKDAYKVGFEQGYNEAHGTLEEMQQSGIETKLDTFDNGYHQGYHDGLQADSYREGFDKGYDSAHEMLEEAIDTANKENEEKIKDVNTKIRQATGELIATQAQLRLLLVIQLGTNKGIEAANALRY